MHIISLDHITFTHYRLTIEALERIEFNRYNKASDFKKDFPLFFRRLVCHDVREECTYCSMYSNCPFGLIFRPKVPLEIKRMPYSHNIPHPFVIKAPLQSSETILPGNKLSFEIAMIGKAQWFIPYFIVTFENLGRKGVGIHPGRFRVTGLEVLTSHGFWESVYNRRDRMVRLPDGSNRFEQVLPQQTRNPQKIRIRFLTPVMIHDQGQWREPRLGPLLKQLIHQVQALSFFYCSHQADVELSVLDPLLAQTASRPRDIQWLDESELQFAIEPEPQRFKGFLGTMEFTGELAPFLPLIYLGEYLHVGEANAFGCGRYAIESPGL